jgi:hypothetical protein
LSDVILKINLNITISFQDNLNQAPSEAFVRKWNRTSRRRWHHDGTVDRYAASKTAWPVPLVESLFLPDYEIKAEQELDDFEVS